MRLFLLCSILMATVLSADDASEKAAQVGADSWLALVDAAKYGDSWEQASGMFKGAVTKDQWTEQAGQVRGQLGKLKSRKLRDSHYTEEIPNAPAGKYVILQYDAVFETGPVIETAILMQEKDASWRVSGYFVKPA